MTTKASDCCPTGSPDPSCSTGLFNFNFNGYSCCANACGVCGGAGCEERPGGAYACCDTSIAKLGRGCDKYPPPCVLPKSSNHVSCALFLFYATTHVLSYRASLKQIRTTLHSLLVAFNLDEPKYQGVPLRSSWFNACNEMSAGCYFLLVCTRTSRRICHR